MVKECCGTCMFWELSWDQDELENLLPESKYCGDCRRYPPVVTTEVPAEFPITEFAMWCGEHKCSTF